MKGSKAILVTLAGFLVTLALVAAFLFYSGVFDNFLKDTVTRFLGSTNYINQPDVYFSMQFLIVVEAMPLWLFAIVGVVFCVFRHSKFDCILIFWLAVMAIIAVPPPHFGRHFAQLIPVLSILGGLAISTLLLNADLPHWRLLGNLKQSGISIFLITITLLTLAPAIEYQTVQYPNTNYTLFGEQWALDVFPKLDPTTRPGKLYQHKCSWSINLYSWLGS